MSRDPQSRPVAENTSGESQAKAECHSCSFRAVPRTSKRRRTKLAVLVNTIAPYRLPIYAALADSFDTLVLHGGNEANRFWTLKLPPALETRQVWTLQIPVKKQTGVAGVWDTQYMHLNLGLLWWLPWFAPDAILTNELGLRTLVALLYGRLAGVPVWVQWEGSLHSERHVSGFKRWVRGKFARHVRHWISYGACSSEYLASVGASPEQILEVQNCVPHETFSVEGKRRWFEGEPGPIILSVGQLIPRKGFDRLIAACGRASARGIPLTLVLVGKGPERDRLIEQAAQAGLKNFHVLPNQSQEALNEIYRSADVFVLPSMEDVWGLVVSEALWAGLPVLCSQYAGAAEMLPQENIFDPVSDPSFDFALQKVWDGRVAAASRERLQTWQEVSGGIRNAIEQATAEPVASEVLTPDPPVMRTESEAVSH